MTRITDNRLTDLAYTPRQVAAIAEASTASVRNWFAGYSRGGVQYPAVVPTAAPSDSSPLRLSFLEMSEAFIIARMRKLGIPLQRIRNAREFVKEEWRCDYPFAEKQFAILGGRIIHQFEEQYPDASSGAIAVDGGGQAPNRIGPCPVSSSRRSNYSTIATTSRRIGLSASIRVDGARRWSPTR